MNAHKTAIKNRLFAVMAVAMMMAVCFVGFVGSSDAAVSGSGTQSAPYVIEMYEGQRFQYNPTVNIAAEDGTTVTIVPSWSNDKKIVDNAFGANGAIDFTVPTGKGSNAAGGEVYTIDILATWTYSGYSLEQTAHQYLEFHVYNNLSVSGDNATILLPGSSWAGTYAGTTVWSSAISGPAATFNAGAWDSGTGFSNGATYFSWSGNGASNGTLSIATGITSIPVGTYKFTATASATHPIGVTERDVKTATVTISVVSGITAPTQTASAIKTFVGDTIDRTSQYTINADANISIDTEGTGVVVDYDGASSYIGHTYNKTSTDGQSYAATGTFTTKHTALVDSLVDSGYKKVYNISVTINGTYPTGLSGVDVKGTVSCQYTVYKSLAFTSAPESTAVTAKAAANDVLNAVITGTYSGANKITYNWGDGKVSVIDKTIDSQSAYSATHQYANPGLYTIIVSASNDNGSSDTVIVYDARYADPEVEEDPVTAFTVTILDKDGAAVGTVAVEAGKKIDLSKITYSDEYDMSGKKIAGLYTSAELEDEFDQKITADITVYADVVDKTFFDEHGWLFIVFAVLALIVLLASYFGAFPVPAPWNYVITVVLAILAVVLFVYVDFGGIIDAISGAFQKN